MANSSLKKRKDEKLTIKEDQTMVFVPGNNKLSIAEFIPQKDGQV